MHQYASECIKMYHNVCRMNYFNVLCMKFQFEKFQFFWLKMTNFFSKCSECINMHQNASKCVQNEMCKCFVHENIKKWVYIAFKGAKISKILATLCDGRPCSDMTWSSFGLKNQFILFQGGSRHFHFCRNFSKSRWNVTEKSRW